uniref:Uncharacterized protein n=1 Tax=Arundo donax TaxID=35708 RepID=A0A0A8Y6Q5_ARUDO
MFLHICSFDSVWTVESTAQYHTWKNQREKVSNLVMQEYCSSVSTIPTQLKVRTQGRRIPKLTPI